jgi:hypothetical protein
MAKREESVEPKRGRPPKRDWAAEAADLLLFLQAGWSVRSIARHYGITEGGMRAVLKRLIGSIPPQQSS